MDDGARHQRELAEGAQRRVSAVQTLLPDGEEDFGGGGLVPEPMVDGRRREVSRPGCNRFVAVRLEIVSDSLQGHAPRDALGVRRLR
jgi:hypothetical protein